MARVIQPVGNTWWRSTLWCSMARDRFEFLHRGPGEEPLGSNCQEVHHPAQPYFTPLSTYHLRFAAPIHLSPCQRVGSLSCILYQLFDFTPSSGHLRPVDSMLSFSDEAKILLTEGIFD